MPRITLGLLAAVVTVSGCAPNPYAPTRSLAELERTLPSLSAGVSLEEVENAFGVKGWHQFTVEREDGCYLCVSCTFFPIGRDCFPVFKNGELIKIIDSMPENLWETIPINEHVGAVVRKPYVPNEIVDAFLQSKDLLGPDLFGSLRGSWCARKKTSIFESNLGPLVPILTIRDIIAYPVRAARNARASEHLRQLDPLQLHIGMTYEEVESTFGTGPVQTIHADDNVVHVFGFDDCTSSWVAVVFRDERVTRFFSHRFFHIQDFRKGIVTFSSE